MRTRISAPRLFLIVVVSVLLTIPALAGDKPTHAMRTGVKSSALRSAWPRETIFGKISMVDTDRKLLIVAGSDKVPYDVVVNHATHIKSGNRSVTVNELPQYQDKNVTVKFMPESHGDVAESIRIGKTGITR